MPTYYSVVLLGDSKVGKSCLINPTKRHYETIGAEHIGISKKSRGNQIILRTWDTGGLDKFRFMTISFIPRADLILLVFDINNYYSFKNLDYWITEIKRFKPHVPIVLVANKSDLPFAVNPDMIFNWCDLHSIKYFFYTSALYDLNVSQLFQQIADLAPVQKEKKWWHFLSYFSN